MQTKQKRIGLRLEVTEAERDDIRKAAALAGYKSMAEFCRWVVLEAAKNELIHVRLRERHEVRLRLPDEE